MSKVAKRRFCPAVQREISSAECGENRGSRYACPAECSFYPFAPVNYSGLLELEDAVEKELIAWVMRDAPDRSAFERELQRARGAKSPHALHSLLVWRIYFAQDAQGLTCAQRWERAGFPGLKNDGRVLFRNKMGIKIGLIEIRRVLDAERTEVVDLLAAKPEPFIVMDRGLASSAARFATGVTWMYSTPHYHRLFGSAILLQDTPSFEPREVVEEIVRHLGGPTEEAAMRRWLAENFLRFESSLNALAIERRRLMFTLMDAKFGKAVYELRAPFAECCDQIDQAPDVDEDTLTDGERLEGFADARVWFAGDDDRALVRETVGTDAVLGRVLLGQAHWRVEAIGGAKLAALRERFERQMGARVKFTGERLDDFGKSMAEKDGKADLSLIPPRLLENPQKLHLASSRMPTPVGKSHEEMKEEFFAAQHRSFLEAAIPALDGRTPREAARDPALRPKLIRLMKARVRMTDEQNLETGSNEDLNWMLRELGLDEIIFDPPPPGRVSRTFVGRKAEDPDEDDIDADFEALPMDPELPLAPRLPDRPFTMDEVDQRMRAAFDPFDMAADALDKMEADGCTLIDDVDEVAADLVDDNSFTLLIPLLANVWFTFVPPGTRGPNLTRADLRDAIQRESLQLLDVLKSQSPAALERYMESGPQPNLSKGMMALVFSGTEVMPKKQRPSPEMQGILGAVLRAVIAELDRAHREWRDRAA